MSIFDDLTINSSIIKPNDLYINQFISTFEYMGVFVPQPNTGHSNRVKCGPAH